jgi:hypothetical protein
LLPPKGSAQKQSEHDVAVNEALKAAGEEFIGGPIPSLLRQEIESKIPSRMPKYRADKKAVKDALLDIVCANFLVRCPLFALSLR